MIDWTKTDPILHKGYFGPYMANIEQFSTPISTHNDTIIWRLYYRDSDTHEIRNGVGKIVDEVKKSIQKWIKVDIVNRSEQLLKELDHD